MSEQGSRKRCSPVVRTFPRAESRFSFSRRGGSRRKGHRSGERRFGADWPWSTSVPPGGAIFVCCVVLRHRIPSRAARRFFSTVCSDRLTALAMGTRNPAVRKLAIPDLTTTVLTLTLTGIGADSSLANGNKPRLARRLGFVAAMFLGGAFCAVVIHYSMSAALGLRPQSPPCALQRCFGLCARPISCDCSHGSLDDRALGPKNVSNPSSVATHDTSE